MAFMDSSGTVIITGHGCITLTAGIRAGLSPPAGGVLSAKEITYPCEDRLSARKGLAIPGTA
jgi:hypothetical protein